MTDDDHPLDNVVWAALTTAHGALATGQGLARHYPRDMAPFSAIAEPSARAYDDLAAGLPPGLEARLFRPREEPAPLGWETVSARPILQMVADPAALDGEARDGPAILLLALADVPDMLALAAVAQPGPFGARTPALGDYVGVRDGAGRLVAMAGERFRLPGHIELSAIAVHPDARGNGLALALTRHLMACAVARGELPFLHVFPDNPAAALYRRWGFRERARHWVIWRRPAAG